MLGGTQIGPGERAAETLTGVLEMNIVSPGHQEQHRLVVEQKHHRLHDRTHIDAQRSCGVGGGVGALGTVHHHPVMTTRNQGVGNVGCIRMK